ncbi:MAG: sugar phosphate isomerase/epimerase [Candidatus Omnitrophica bacterium]|nr:sugar phosphate isomerase/epimerase [Candidatus Omnitrophota bacterium]
MRYTSSPWGFRFWDFERYCDFMKKIEIQDICSMFMFKGGETLTLLFRRDRDEIKRARETADRKGIRLIEVSITDKWKEEIPLAEILGVKYLRVCTVWEDKKEVFNNVVEELKETGKMASEYGMEVVVENHGGPMTKAERCKQLIEAVGMDNVKINYDPANFLYYGEDPVSAIDYILPYIGFTHFKSVKYQDGKPKYCRLSEGVIDYKKVFEKLFNSVPSSLGKESKDSLSVPSPLGKESKDSLSVPSPLRGEGKDEGGKDVKSYTGYIGLEYEEPTDVEQGTIDDFNYLKNILERR